MNPLYNTVHGNFLLQYNVGTELNTLGTHQMYILIPIAFLYKFFPSADFLLILQSFIIGLGALPLYLISKDLLMKKSFNYIVPVLYLLTPTVQWTNIYDFHPETFATTLILFLWYFLQKRKFFSAIFFMFLIISCKEDMGFANGAICLAFAFIYKEKKEKLLMCIGAVLSIAVSIVEVQYLIPMFNTIHQSYFIGRYAYLGKTPKDIALNLIEHPKLLITSLFGSSDKLQFLIKIFFQTGFFAFFSFVILASSTQIGMDLLGSSTMHSITYQYTTIINAVLWISTIYGIKTLIQITDKYIHREQMRYKFAFCIIGILITTSLISNFLYSPILSPKWFRQELKTSKTRVAIINQMIKQIPNDQTVDASDYIAPQLSNRKIIQIFPEKCNAQYLIWEPLIVNGASNYNDCLNKIHGHYVFIFKQNGYFIAKKL